MTNIVITGCSTGIGLETAKYLEDKFIEVLLDSDPRWAIKKIATKEENPEYWL